MQAQVDEFLKEIQKGGWTIYGPMDWRKIEARYRSDRDLADTVPRELMYFDMGVLFAHIGTLENELATLKKKKKKKKP